MRYFIVTGVVHYKGKSEFSHFDLSASFNNYPTRRMIKESLINQNKDIVDINILNIIEINKEDYESFLS